MAAAADMNVVTVGPQDSNDMRNRAVYFDHISSASGALDHRITLAENISICAEIIDHAINRMCNGEPSQFKRKLSSQYDLHMASFTYERRDFGDGSIWSYLFFHIQIRLFVSMIIWEMAEETERTDLNSEDNVTALVKELQEEAEKA